MKIANIIITAIISIAFVVGVIGWTYMSWGLFASLVCGSLAVVMVKGIITSPKIEYNKPEVKEEKDNDEATND